jgi:hypothetical protein
MNNMMCRIFGHNWNSGWAGAYGGPFGAVVVNYKTCERCDKKEHEYTTETSINAFNFETTDLSQGSK